MTGKFSLILQTPLKNEKILNFLLFFWKNKCPVLFTRFLYFFGIPDYHNFAKYHDTFFFIYYYYYYYYCHLIQLFRSIFNQLKTARK